MNFIKQYRIKNGLTQDQLAMKIGVTRAAIAQWETGRSLPSARIACRIAEVIGCTIDELYGRTAKTG